MSSKNKHDKKECLIESLTIVILIACFINVGIPLISGIYQAHNMNIDGKQVTVNIISPNNETITLNGTYDESKSTLTDTKKRVTNIQPIQNQMVELIHVSK